MDTKILIVLIIIAAFFYYNETSSKNSIVNDDSSENNIIDDDSSENNIIDDDSSEINVDYNWGVYKGNSSYVAARNNTNANTKNTILYECISNDGKNCFWRQSYDEAKNDLTSISSNLIKPVAGNWTDLVKMTSPPPPAPWKVCAHPSGTFVVARDDTSTFKKMSECVTTDGANCTWYNDRNGPTNELNNLPSKIKPLKGGWGLVC